MNNLAIVEHKGIRVLTTAQLAEVYETDSNNITKNFTRNIERFTEGKDYHVLQGAELKAFKSNMTDSPFASNLNKLYLWTDRGANRHSKILDTDKAWQQFDVLEETYFNVKNNVPQLPQNYLEALESLVVSTKALAAAESTVSLLMHTDKTYTATEIAKELGFRSAQRFNDWLRTRSIIFDVNGTTVLRSTYADRGYYSIKQCIPESGNVVYNSKWTQEGRRFLVNLRNQG